VLLGKDLTTFGKLSNLKS